MSLRMHGAERACAAVFAVVPSESSRAYGATRGARSGRGGALVQGGYHVHHGTLSGNPSL